MRESYEDIRDELLVLEFQDGDRDAFQLLYRRWQPRLTRLAWRLTGEQEASNDISQEAWIAILRGLKRLDDPARFRVWAYRIVSNKCADWIRRRVVRRKAERNLGETSVTDLHSIDAGSTDGMTLMREALALLPPEQRAILSLHYLDGLGIVEIGRVLGAPSGTVKSRLFYARKRLRQVMERTGK